VTTDPLTGRTDGLLAHSLAAGSCPKIIKTDSEIESYRQRASLVVAAYTGWNLRKAGFAEGELCENNGSMLPFAATREDRLNSNDPRLSLAERYPRSRDRAAAVAKAAKQPAN
jgi:hypothetical protein